MKVIRYASLTFEYIQKFIYSQSLIRWRQWFVTKTLYRSKFLLVYENPIGPHFRWNFEKDKLTFGGMPKWVSPCGHI